MVFAKNPENLQQSVDYFLSVRLPSVRMPEELRFIPNIAHFCLLPNKALTLCSVCARDCKSGTS
jgi:hypothetical protein